jgi:hypothetical protein
MSPQFNLELITPSRTPKPQQERTTSHQSRKSSTGLNPDRFCNPQHHLSRPTRQQRPSLPQRSFPPLSNTSRTGRHSHRSNQPSPPKNKGCPSGTFLEKEWCPSGTIGCPIGTKQKIKGCPIGTGPKIKRRPNGTIGWPIRTTKTIKPMDAMRLDDLRGRALLKHNDDQSG